MNMRCFRGALGISFTDSLLKNFTHNFYTNGDE